MTTPAVVAVTVLALLVGSLLAVTAWHYLTRLTGRHHLRGPHQSRIDLARKRPRR